MDDFSDGGGVDSPPPLFYVIPKGLTDKAVGVVLYAFKVVL